jgi:hypothetical protein
MLLPWLLRVAAGVGAAAAQKRGAVKGSSRLASKIIKADGILPA